MTAHEWIYEVVNAFYAKARTDILIRYQFDKIKDFDEHIPRISAFWEMQLTGKSDRRLDRPFDMIGVHGRLHLHRGELGRWLILFRQTLDEKVKEHPEFQELREKWEERLPFFEKVFLRMFFSA